MGKNSKGSKVQKKASPTVQQTDNTDHVVVNGAVNPTHSTTTNSPMSKPSLTPPSHIISDEIIDTFSTSKSPLMQHSDIYPVNYIEEEDIDYYLPEKSNTTNDIVENRTRNLSTVSIPYNDIYPDTVSPKVTSKHISIPLQSTPPLNLSGSVSEPQQHQEGQAVSLGNISMVEINFGSPAQSLLQDEGSATPDEEEDPSMSCWKEIDDNLDEGVEDDLQHGKRLDQSGFMLNEEDMIDIEEFSKVEEDTMKGIADKATTLLHQYGLEDEEEALLVVGDSSEGNQDRGSSTLHKKHKKKSFVHNIEQVLVTFIERLQLLLIEMMTYNLELLSSKVIRYVERFPITLLRPLTRLIVSIIRWYVRCIVAVLHVISDFGMFVVKIYIWMIFLPLYVMEYMFGSVFVSLLRMMISLVNSLPGSHHIRKVVNGEAHHQ